MFSLMSTLTLASFFVVAASAILILSVLVRFGAFWCVLVRFGAFWCVLVRFSFLFYTNTG